MVVRLELREEKGNGIELEKSNGGERESREKRDYGGERDVDFFFFWFRDKYEMYLIRDNKWDQLEYKH